MGGKKGQTVKKGTHRNSQTIQVTIKTIDCPVQTDIKIPLLKTTPTGLIEDGNVKLVVTQSLHRHVLLSLLTRTYFAHSQKRNISTDPVSVPASLKEPQLLVNWPFGNV